LDEVLAALGPARTVELAVLVGWYHLVAAVVEPLRVAIEPDKRRNGLVLEPAAERRRPDGTRDDREA
ncbi:MAG: hypothetical protein ACXVH7_12175, partial [Thermoanaerobaculia bacterium]